MKQEPVEHLLVLGEKIGRGQREPNRVVVEASGKAVSDRQAMAVRYDIRWTVCFIRDDGWCLAAPEHLREVAWKIWESDWAVVVERGGIPHPVLNGRCPEGCGACCAYLVVHPEEVDAIREPKILAAIETPEAKYQLPVIGDDGQELVQEWPDSPLLSPRLVDGKMLGCALLDGKKRCSIYQTRPACCLCVPVGGAQCRQARETMFADLASRAARKAAAQ
jgi:Fe-S-cluster containining protein